MRITKAADAPPCNTDGALPLFTLSCLSQSDEPAFYRYFTYTIRLCPFLRQPCSPTCHSIVFLPFSSIFSPVLLDVFTLSLRSSTFTNPLSSDESAVSPTVNQYQNEGRREAEGRQKGGRREAGRLQALSIAFCHLCAFVSIFAYQVLAAKVALPWYETKVEKDQFGELPQIAAFCGVQQCCLQSWDGNTGTCLVGYCVQTKLA